VSCRAPLFLKRYPSPGLAVISEDSKNQEAREIKPLYRFSPIWKSKLVQVFSLILSRERVEKKNKKKKKKKKQKKNDRRKLALLRNPPAQQWQATGKVAGSHLSTFLTHYHMRPKEGKVCCLSNNFLAIGRPYA